MKENLVKIVTGLIIEIVLVVGVMAPIIESAEDDQIKTFYNGGQRVSYITQSTSGTYVIDESGNGVATIGGVAVTLMPGNYNIASDSFTISNLGTFWHMFYVNNGSSVFVGYVNGFDFEIDVITKVMTITNIQYSPSATDQSVTSISVAYDWIALPDDSGGNAIFRTTESVYDAYVPSIQNVRAITISGQNFYSFDATYVYDNGVSVGTFNYPTLNETTWDGIYTIPISTTSGFELGGGIYASGYILPYIVEYINEGSQTTFKLVYTIPIFVMLGLLMASGYLIFKKGLKNP